MGTCPYQRGGWISALYTLYTLRRSVTLLLFLFLLPITFYLLLITYI